MATLLHELILNFTKVALQQWIIDHSNFRDRLINWVCWLLVMVATLRQSYLVRTTRSSLRRFRQHIRFRMIIAYTPLPSLL